MIKFITTHKQVYQYPDKNWNLYYFEGVKMDAEITWNYQFKLIAKGIGEGLFLQYADKEGSTREIKIETRSMFLDIIENIDCDISEIVKEF